MRCFANTLLFLVLFCLSLSLRSLAGPVRERNVQAHQAILKTLLLQSKAAHAPNGPAQTALVRNYLLSLDGPIATEDLTYDEVGQIMARLALDPEVGVDIFDAVRPADVSLLYLRIDEKREPTPEERRQAFARQTNIDLAEIKELLTLTNSPHLVKRKEELARSAFEALWTDPPPPSDSSCSEQFKKL